MRGAFGARKNPTKLANKIGVNGAKLVSFVKSNVVLTGVRVTAALSPAIVQIMARAGLSPGIKTAIALSIQARGDGGDRGVEGVEGEKTSPTSLPSPPLSPVDL